MIEKIQIRDYRSCHDSVVNLRHDLSVLIGPNGSGKTTVLNGINLLRKLVYFRPNHRNEHIATDESSLKVWFRIGNKKAILHAKIKLFTEPNNSDVIVDSEESWYVKDFTGSAKRVKIPLRMVNIIRRFRREKSELTQHIVFDDFIDFTDFPTEVAKPLAEVGGFISEIQYYSASQFTNPSQCPVSIEVEKSGERSRALGNRGVHVKFLHDMFSAYRKSNNEDFQEFLNVIGPNAIGLVDEIEFKEILTSSIDYRVRSGGEIRELKREKTLVVPQFIIGSNVLSPSQLSEGTFKTITLLFYVMTQRSSALLIEEPEVCVHHGLLSSIVELIKTYSMEKQIVLTTHSDFVLDQLSPEHVFSVSKDHDGGTQISNIPDSMSSSELSGLKKYLEKEGNLGEYWRHGGFE